jgi:hypothetical protein
MPYAFIFISQKLLISDVLIIISKQLLTGHLPGHLHLKVSQVKFCLDTFLP